MFCSLTMGRLMIAWRRITCRLVSVSSYQVLKNFMGIYLNSLSKVCCILSSFSILHRSHIDSSWAISRVSMAKKEARGCVIKITKEVLRNKKPMLQLSTFLYFRFHKNKSHEILAFLHEWRWSCLSSQIKLRSLFYSYFCVGEGRFIVCVEAEKCG